MSAAFTIGELARAADVGVETVRYYERRGLIVRPPRPRSGYRRYTWETVRRLRFIRRAQALGFTLEEIRELLALRVDAKRTCADVRGLARAKLDDIDAKMGELARMRRGLERLERRCRGQGPTSECPILDVLDEETDGETDAEG